MRSKTYGRREVSVVLFTAVACMVMIPSASFAEEAEVLPVSLYEEYDLETGDMIPESDEFTDIMIENEEVIEWSTAEDDEVHMASDENLSTESFMPEELIEDEEGEDELLEAAASNIDSVTDFSSVLTLGGTVSATVNRYAYPFTPSENGIYRFLMTSTYSSGFMNPKILILDKDGNRLSVSETGYEEENLSAASEDGQEEVLTAADRAGILRSYWAEIPLTGGETYYVLPADDYAGGDACTLTVAKTASSDSGASQNEYPASIWPITGDMFVEEGEEVTLRVGWSVPGDDVPAITWTINGKQQEETGDTLTFTAFYYRYNPNDPNQDDLYDEDGTLSIRATIQYGEEKFRTGFTVEVYSEHSHNWGPWITDKKPTALSAGSRHRVCSVCDEKETASVAKLAPFIKLNVTGTLPMKTKQTCSKITAQLEKGDRITNWTSRNTKVVTVDKNGVLKAKKKTGKAVITVTTAAGASASFTVKVQKTKVKTKKITVPSTAKKLNLSKGEKYDLGSLVSVTPVSNQDKVKYKLSKKGIVKVTKKGVVTARKKGKTTITVQSGNKKVKVQITVR